MGFTINTLTLLAMVLAIGLVVDDAIVVLENIYRHIEDGMQPFAAAIEGTQRDRLRRRRHDADAGGRLCADRLRAGTHRAAVPGVRADAGRRRARLGLRGADADADDVLQAAAARAKAAAASSPRIERGFTAFERGYRRLLGAALRRALPRHRSWRSASPALERRVLSRCCKSELAPVEDRGLIQVRGTGAGRRDARLHQPLQHARSATSWPRCRRSSRR